MQNEERLCPKCKEEMEMVMSYEVIVLSCDSCV